MYGEKGRRFLHDIPIDLESDKDLMNRIPDIDRIRYASPDRVPDALFRAAAETGFFISRAKVSMEGRIELLRYFREQSVCFDYHRYGNLGERAVTDQSAQVLLDIFP
jgi:RHH-type transcriptional regulator, proline utilization regulon repressor / proline dehydrogenase / delta 1-pyrroline-5-carboxylate dehydrogenase